MGDRVRDWQGLWLLFSESIFAVEGEALRAFLLEVFIGRVVRDCLLLLCVVLDPRRWIAMIGHQPLDTLIEVFQVQRVVPRVPERLRSCGYQCWGQSSGRQEEKAFHGVDVRCKSSTNSPRMKPLSRRIEYKSLLESYRRCRPQGIPYSLYTSSFPPKM